jgi:uncharacterized protein
MVVQGTRFNVLALTGGGYRGLYTAHVLAELERFAGRPLGQCFDLIAGTSIGGILALALAFEIPMVKVVDEFHQRASSIFRRRGLLAGWTHAKYSQAGLRQAIEAIFSSDATLEMAQHAVIVPALNLTHGEPQVFKTKHNETYHRDYRYRVTDIALATSAAPVFFPIAELDNQLFADGGLFANAPDLAALHEAEKFLSTDPATICMLSIGTTTSKYAIAHDRDRDFGAFQWMRGARLLDVMLSAQRQLSVQIVRHRLADRYIEIDNQPAAEIWATLGLDRGDNIAHATLRGLASRDAASRLARVELRDMLTHMPRRWVIPAA